MDRSSAPESQEKPVQADPSDGLIEILGGPLDAYCEGLLKVQTKKGELKPLIFNRAQAYVDAKLEAQLDRDKRVRALILKGRKVGISTYVAGRFFRRQHALTDTAIYILTHEDPATRVLFNIAKRYYNNLPAQWRPQAGLANEKTMTFPNMRCSYSVGTAGGKGSARSATYQLFHGSEVAFWPNAGAHLAGALQTVADVPGTEVILESTANGIGGAFHEMWLRAEAGEGGYQAIFIPWFWDDELRRVPPAGWIPIEEEREYQRLHQLTDEQMYWAHLKNIELGGQPGKWHWQFKQEYPATAQEAFQSSGGEGLVKSDLVLAARKNIIRATEYDARLLGVDCAVNVTQGDSSVMIDRCGRVAGGLVYKRMKTDKPMELVGVICELHAIHLFHMIFIDVGHIGKAVYDRLVELGHGPHLCAVEYGGEATDKERYKNKRAEIYMAGADWFSLPGGVRCPDDDVFHRECCAVDRKPSSDRRIVMKSKIDIKKEFGFSPDGWDALVNTFAVPVLVPETRAIAARRTHRRRRGWGG